MIDREFARRIVAEHIEEGCRTRDGVTPVILDHMTAEHEFGWVFFYQAREFLDTGNISLQLAGNAPLIVDREDGSLHVTGTARPVAHYVAEYARKRTAGR